MSCGAATNATYTYDVLNRLTKITDSSYKYDALERRIQRAPSSGVSTNFIYDGQDVVKDTNSDGSTVEYLNGPGIDNKIRQKGASSSTSYYFSQDHLGSTTALTGTTGKLVERITYDGFGNSVGSTRTRYGFTGRERDPLTGLLHYRARSYDPQLGRFISEDPIGLAGGINQFAYVGNNPANSVDPTGLWDRSVHIRIINEAFKCLNAAALEKLENANDEVDGVLNGGAWLEKYSYQHGMRAPWETVDEARKKADDWINDHMAKARALSPNGCRFGGNNIPGKALEKFGLALHTLMDMTSPSHAGFQVWHGLPYPTGITLVDLYRYRKWKKEIYDPHAAQETLAVFNSDPVRRQSIINAAKDAFKKAFGDCCCTR
jgi:RHS repeat-associated protein